tara:strand:- start:790 stop:909 length:120 start_codon:yes stop_codon:yes gene_type:complete
MKKGLRVFVCGRRYAFTGGAEAHGGTDRAAATLGGSDKI